jgi:hypothetical protein
MRSWFVDVDGSRLSVTTEVHAPSPSSSSETQLQQIVESIRFD